MVDIIFFALFTTVAVSVPVLVFVWSRRVMREGNDGAPPLRGTGRRPGDDPRTRGPRM